MSGISKTAFFIAVIVLVLVSSSTIVLAQGNDSITLRLAIKTLDQQTDSFNIIGWVEPVYTMSRVSLSIINPVGDIVLTKQLSVDPSDGFFETGLISRYELGQLVEGTYTVLVKHSPAGTEAFDTFEYFEEEDITPWQGPDESQYPPLFVEVNTNLYFPNEMLRVSGFVKDLNAYTLTAVALQILDPTDEIIAVDQLIPDTDGRFSATFTTGGPLWEHAGQYTINVVYDRQKATTIFDYMLERPGSGIVDPLNNELEQLQIENTALKQENTHLQSQIEQLQKKIDDLNAIIMEQIKVIYDWVLTR